MSETGGSPEFGPKMEQMQPGPENLNGKDFLKKIGPELARDLATINKSVELSEDLEPGEKRSPNRLVQKFIDAANRQLVELGVVPSKFEIERGIDEAEDFANLSLNPEGREQRQEELIEEKHERNLKLKERWAHIPPAEQTKRELNNLPVAEREITEALLRVVQIPKHIMERMAGDPDSDPTSDELIEIYQGIKQELETNPEAATFDALGVIIDSELAETKLACDKARLLENPTENFMHPLIMKLNSMTTCEKAVKMMKNNKTRNRLKATSEEGEALLSYLSKTRDSFESAKEGTEDAEKLALAGAGVAFFDALYDQMPD